MRKRSLSFMLVVVLVVLSITFVSAGTSYIVKPGDVLSRIAKTYNTTWQRLAEINNLKNPDLIFPDQVIKIGEEEAADVYKAGIYSATAKGFGGDVTVTINVDANKITHVSIIASSETESIAGRALTKLPESIISKQSAEVDVVSGATVTSKAVIEATKAAIDKAKGVATKVGAISFTPGTYSGKGRGYNGVVELAVTFSDKEITNIEIVTSRETDRVGTPAFDILFDEIKEYTSTGVDVVSGATLTSNAILAAVEDAAKQAGCDLSALRAGAMAYILNPGTKIVDTYDVVVIGAGGAGVTAAAAAAQKGATVLVIEKEAEAGGNTLVAGCSYQTVLESLVWDPYNPDALAGVYSKTGETYEKSKSELGRLDTLKTILNWSEKPFDGSIKDPSAIKDVYDYDLPNRGVHAEYLDTLKTLKEQIKAYVAWVEPQMAAGAKENDLTLFSTVELHIFQTYSGGLRLNNDKTEWIYGDYELVSQICREIEPTKEWLMDQGSIFRNSRATGTLLGCLWQRIIGFDGGMVNGSKVEGKWGTYFAVPINTILSANKKNQIMYRTTATELIADSQGRVTGVKAVKYDGTEVEITAKKGVIVATGGFAANIEMVMETNEYWDSKDITSSMMTTNRSLAQGDGIKMATDIGAEVVGMGYTQLMPTAWVDSGGLAGATGGNLIFVSPSGTENAGKRYVDESAERDVIAQGAFDYGKDGVYIQINNAGSFTSANAVEGRQYYLTLAEAAKMLEIDINVLRNTIVEYDNAYRNGTLDQLDVPKSAAIALIGNYNEDGSFKEDGLLAVRYLKPSTHHTMGGLKINAKRQVLDANGNIIKGLYAAGEVTGGIFAGNRLGGNAITEILVSGRIAGESVAAE